MILRVQRATSVVPGLSTIKYQLVLQISHPDSRYQSSRYQDPRLQAVVWPGYREGDAGIIDAGLEDSFFS